MIKLNVGGEWWVVCGNGLNRGLCRLLLSFFLLLATHYSPLTTHRLYAVPTGMSFLKYAVGAKANAMGGAYLAQAQDASAIYWNPSAIASMPSSELFFYRSQFVLASNYNYAAYVHPFKTHKAAYGLAYASYSQGSLDARDSSGNSLGSYAAADSLATFSFARKVNSKLSLGMGLNILQSSIGSFSANGWAFDLASTYKYSARTRFAAGLFHAGPKMQYITESFSLPTTLGFGVSHQFLTQFNLGLDTRYRLYDQNLSLSLGADVNLGEVMSFQMGYLSSLKGSGVGGQGSGMDALSGLGMGIGLKLFSKVNLDYAFVPMVDLGATHHVSLTWRFSRD